MTGKNNGFNIDKIVLSLMHYWQQEYCSKRGRTLKLQRFASLYFGSGLTNNYLALVVIFNMNIFNQRLFRAGRLQNIPPAAIPERWL
jgi:hypothetical protein